MLLPKSLLSFSAPKIMCINNLSPGRTPSYVFQAGYVFSKAKEIIKNVY